jgi:hypothetical protein
VPCSAINVSRASSDNDGVATSEEDDACSCPLCSLSIRVVTYRAKSLPFEKTPTYIFYKQRISCYMTFLLQIRIWRLLDGFCGQRIGGGCEPSLNCEDDAVWQVIERSGGK